MSSIYQEYSGRKIKRNQDLTEKYLIEQINIFKRKSSNSIKDAQNYAIDQNLIYPGTNNDQNPYRPISNGNSQENLNDFNFKFLGPITNIENVRVSAANQIRVINLQIKKINNLDQTDYEILQYFGSSIPALVQQGLPQTLKNIEEQLVLLRSNYTEKDPSIMRLLDQRKLTVNLLKSRAIKYLKVAKLEAEATMEAAMRPKGVLLKYKELIREADRDEKTLISLENDLRLIKLQKAKFSDPWELITKPTLLKISCWSIERKIGLFGLVIGLLTGILLSIYKEKNLVKFFLSKNWRRFFQSRFWKKSKEMIISANLNK